MSISVTVYKQENSNITKKKFIVVIKTEIPNLNNDFFCLQSALTGRVIKMLWYPVVSLGTFKF